MNGPLLLNIFRCYLPLPTLPDGFGVEGLGEDGLGVERGVDPPLLLGNFN